MPGFFCFPCTRTTLVPNDSPPNPQRNLFAMTTDSTTQPTDAATPKAPATKPAKASKKPAGDINKSNEIRKLATAS